MKVIMHDEDRLLELGINIMALPGRIVVKQYPSEASLHPTILLFEIEETTNGIQDEKS